VVPEVKQTRFDIHSPAAGGRLEAVWIGPGPDDAPTLVFLHEGLGCVALWRDFPRRLVHLTGCGALVYSRLGYGCSDPAPLPRPVTFMHHEGLEVLPDVIRQTGIRDHLLIGHSDGGSIALIYAGGHLTPRLMGVVTLAAHVFCEELTCQSIQAARKKYLNGDLKPRLGSYHGANTDAAFWGWNDVWLLPEFRQWRIDALLPTIRAPLLAIQGDADPYGTRAQVDRIQAACGSRVTTAMIPGCGHAPHLEYPQAVLAPVVGFVRGRLPDNRP
jgi:pimeloyl-ACP methyl ester carboxylesterase